MPYFWSKREISICPQAFYLPRHKYPLEVPCPTFDLKEKLVYVPRPSTSRGRNNLYRVSIDFISTLLFFHISTYFLDTEHNSLPLLFQYHSKYNIPCRGSWKNPSSSVRDFVCWLSKVRKQGVSHLTFPLSLSFSNSLFISYVYISQLVPPLSQYWYFLVLLIYLHPLSTAHSCTPWGLLSCPCSRWVHFQSWTHRTSCFLNLSCWRAALSLGICGPQAICTDFLGKKSERVDCLSTGGWTLSSISQEPCGWDGCAHDRDVFVLFDITQDHV